MRSSGVPPTSWRIESTPVVLIDMSLSVGILGRPASVPAALRGQADGHQPGGHVEGGHAVPDERAAQYGPSLGGEDVEDGLADQQPAAHQGPAGSVVQD